MGVQSYRDLTVWRKGMQLAADAYRLTREMPNYEEYRLSAQIIKAASSIPANIAEAHGRSTRKDYAHFVSISCGSLFELETSCCSCSTSNLRHHRAATVCWNGRMRSAAC